MCVLDLYTDTHAPTHTHIQLAHMHVFNYSTSFDAAFINSSPRSWVAFNFLLSTSHYPLSTFHFLLAAYSLLLAACCLLPSRMHIQCTRKLSSLLLGRTKATAVKCRDACHTHTHLHTHELFLSHTHTRKIIKLFILMQTFLLLQATVNYTPSALCAQQQNKIKRG